MLGQGVPCKGRAALIPLILIFATLVSHILHSFTLHGDMQPDLFSEDYTYSILETVEKLFEVDEYLVAIWFTITSVAWPYIRLVILFLIANKCFESKKFITIFLSNVNATFAKYSMVDPLFVAVLTTATFEETYVAGGITFHLRISTVGLPGLATFIVVATLSIFYAIFLKWRISTEGVGGMKMGFNRDIVQSTADSGQSAILCPTMKGRIFMASIAFLCAIIAITSIFIPVYELEIGVMAEDYGLDVTSSHVLSLWDTFVYNSSQALGVMLLIGLVFFPIVKWLVFAVLILRKSEWAEPCLEFCTAWDLRDVYLITLILLELRINDLIRGISHEYSHMDITAHYGAWVVLTSCVIDYFILYLMIRKQHSRIFRRMSMIIGTSQTSIHLNSISKANDP